jgi:hypothetical protein
VLFICDEPEVSGFVCTRRITPLPTAELFRVGMTGRDMVDDPNTSKTALGTFPFPLSFLYSVSSREGMFAGKLPACLPVLSTWCFLDRFLSVTLFVKELRLRLSIILALWLDIIFREASELW